MAVHPAYDAAFDGFAPPLHGNPQARQRWACEKLHQAAMRLRAAGLTAHATFSGRWHGPFFIRGRRITVSCFEEAFAAAGPPLAAILDRFDQQGVDVCYEIHPRRRSARWRDLRAFSAAGGITIRAAICSMTRAICICSRWTTWPISISTTRGLKRFTSRTRSSAATAAVASMAATSPGCSGAGVSARLGTGRSISKRIFSKLTAI